MAVKLLILAGSLRRDSLNRKLAMAVTGIAAMAGAEASCRDLRDYPLPVYDGDIEAADGPPEEAFRLQADIAAHSALIIVSPEYNHSIPGPLKNTLDWVSRTPRFRGDNPFAGKLAALMSASPGGFGGLRGLDHLRRVVETLGALVLPQVVGLPHADQAFDADGWLKDETTAGRVRALVDELLRTAGKLTG